MRTLFAMVVATVGGCTSSAAEPDAAVPVDERPPRCPDEDTGYLTGEIREPLQPLVGLAGGTVMPSGVPTLLEPLNDEGDFEMCMPFSPYTGIIDVDLPGEFIDAHITDAISYSQPRCLAFTPATLAAALAVVGETVDPTRGTLVVYENRSTSTLVGGGTSVVLGNAWVEDTGQLEQQMRMFVNVEPGTAEVMFMNWPLPVPVTANEVTCFAVPVLPI